MTGKSDVKFVACGPNWLRGKVRRAVESLGAECSESGLAGAVVVMHIDCGGAANGPERLRLALASGALAGIGVSPTRDHRARNAFFAAGAADVLTPDGPVAEWAHRIRRVACGEALLARRARETEEARVLFQAVIDALPVSLHAIDRDFRIVVWNRAREAGPLGRSRGQVLGQSLFDAIGDSPDLRREYEEIFRTGRPTVTEVQSTAVDPPHVFQVEKLPMRLGAGDEITHVITFARDVTAQRSLERSMAQTEKLAAAGRIAAGVAHEINNPLATIAGCAEALRTSLSRPLADDERAEAQSDAGVIVEEAYRCKEILGGLLDFSRPKPDPRGPCDPADLARRAIRLLRHNPRVASVRLTLDIGENVPPVWANEDQLVQVLLALALNAADAAAPEGSVALVVARCPDDGVVLAVEDDGPGIPPEIADRIIDPFFTTKPPGLGTGLGLSVAYGLVQAHGGRLSFTSTPGRLTRFEVVLPAYDESAVETSR